MLARIFGVTLPPQTDEQTGTHLDTLDLTLDSEILSAAYEPRYELTAFGTSTGQLYVINKLGHLFRSKFDTPCPVLWLTQCTNSSSFFAMASPTLYRGHATLRRSHPSPLRRIDESRVQSTLIHWIITHNEVVPRCLTTTIDLVAAAIPPSYPMYALVADTTGAIRGFSLEEMRFTRLYINIFEGRPVRALFCGSGLTFYVCHDCVERISVQEGEVAAFAPHVFQSFDMNDDIAAAIDMDGHAGLFSPSKCLQRADMAGTSAIAARIIEGRHWLAVVRGGQGDVVWVDGQIRLGLAPNFAVPAILIKYADPFKREAPTAVEIVNEFGTIIPIGQGRQIDHFPGGDFKPIGGKNVGGVIRMWSDRETAVVSNWSFVGTTQNSLGIPIAFFHERAIIMDSGVASLVDFETNEQTAIEVFPVTGAQSCASSLYLVSDDRLFSVDLMAETFDVMPVEGFTPTDEHLFWRRFQESFITISTANVLAYGDVSVQICEADEQIIFCEVVDEDGHTATAGFIVIVTGASIYVFVFADRDFRRVRKVSVKAVQVALSGWGTLQVVTKTKLLLISVPDVSFAPIFTAKLHPNETPVLLPGDGFAAIGNLGIRWFVRGLSRAGIYAEEQVAPFKEPSVSVFWSLFGRKSPTLKDADDTFKHRRTPRARTQLDETVDQVQQMLVTAQERSEVLSEMEIKAEQIATAARNFRKMAEEIKNQQIFPFF